MLSTLVNLDTDLLLWLNSFHSTFWDIFMNIVTDKLTWFPMYAVILYVLVRKYGFKLNLLWTCLMFFTLVLITDQLCGHLIRSAIGRYRPSNPLNPISPYVHIVDGYRGGRYGFPSCHAANTFGLATLLLLFFRNRLLTITAYSWAVLNCYSRIYLGVHYPGDILVGAIIGSIVAVGVYYAFKHYLKFKETNYKHLNFISYTCIFSIVCILCYTIFRILIFT